MNRQELIRYLRKQARQEDKYFAFEASHGKGSHGMLYYGDRKTTCPDGELKKYLVKAILKQLQVEA